MNTPALHSKKINKVLCFFIIAVFLFLNASLSRAEETVVGIVFSGRLSSYFKTDFLFQQKLKETFNDKNLKIIYQKPLPDSLAWANAIRKLLAYNAEIIIAYGSGATEAAIYEATGKPIIGVFITEDTFKKTRYKKLALVQYKFPAISMIRYIQDLGIASRIGFLESSLEPSSTKEADSLVRLSSKLGIENIRLKISNNMELTMRLKLFRYSCLIVTHSALILENISKYKEFILDEKVPVISMLDENRAISLVSFEPDPKDMADALYEVFQAVLHGKYRKKTIYRTKLIYNLALSKRLNIEPSVKLITVADEVLK